VSDVVAAQDARQTQHAYLSVRFFGSFSVFVAGVPVERWRAGKSRSFFQYLMLHRGRLMTRDQLRAALWPDAEWCSSSSSLKVACHGARGALGASKQPGPLAGPGIRVLHRDGGYLLDADDAWSDAEEFSWRIREGMQHYTRRRLGSATKSLTAAMTLYQGDFLAGQDEDWVVEMREYHRSQAVRALDVLRGAAMACGDADRVVALGRRTLQIDALHEPTYQDLITIAGRLGQLEQAVRWYWLCAERLGRVIGVEPSAQTRQALAQVQAAGRPQGTGRPSQGMGRPPGTRPLALATHR
jgi:DNA-binding SARP family transcriptional activator